MPVTLTSPALGQDAGTTYTGPEEAWLLAEGYARQDGYTGVGVSNTGPTDVAPADDPSLPANREPEPSRDEEGNVDAREVSYDFDAGGVDTEKPSAFTVAPNELALAGEDVTIEGQNLTGTTGVTVGGTAATNVDVVDDSTVTATFPAKAAGTYDVVVTDNVGSTTEVGEVTYA